MFKYFKDSEIVGLDLGLVKMLDQAREIAGIPFIITSGLRTSAEEVAAGRNADNAHTRGVAVDILCKDSNQRFLILKSLFAVGFIRIGDEDTHIHADIDTILDVNVVWR